MNSTNQTTFAPASVGQIQWIKIFCRNEQGKKWVLTFDIIAHEGSDRGASHRNGQNKHCNAEI